MKPSRWLVVVLVGSVLGLLFASVSTYDFVQHLDRQVHSLHCSFIPGMGHATGESGCQAAMMSPYSSIFRTHVWGGIPISLGAMAVFAFIAFYTGDLLVTRRKGDRRATAFLFAATAVPMLVSIIMALISITQLGTACKLCIGIYLASTACFVGALMQWRSARRGGGNVSRLQLGMDAPAASNRFLGGMVALGAAFVLVPVLLYLAVAPDHERFIGTCEVLPKPEDPNKIMLPLRGTEGRGAYAVEVLDPLCPACKAFEQRIVSSGFDEKLSRHVVLFPLDNTCNWMVTEATHPGACTVSEAVLCAGNRAPEVIAWAFVEQDRIRAETKADPAAAARIVKQRFPELAACVGSPDAKAKLNKSLRWAVANNLHVLTPQLFVEGVKLCDEDVDLGLDYTLTKMLERREAGTLAPKKVTP